MNVTTARLDGLRSAYSSALGKTEQAQKQLDSATLELDERAVTADKLANRYNRWVSARQKMPIVGMGSFLVGMTLVQTGVFTHNPWLGGLGLVGFAACAACVVGIETWKQRGPRMRAEHDALLARHQSQYATVDFRKGALELARKALEGAEQALRKEEASIDELQRLLKPPTLAGISEQRGSVTVGAIRIPKRLKT